MESTKTLKRQNFNVTPEEEAQLQSLREILNAPSIKDAVLRAARILLTLDQETREGRRIFSIDRSGAQTRLLLPDIEAPAPRWKYLAPRPESWKQQLFVKGRRLTAANVWFSMLANKRTPQEEAEAWDLPLEAIEEIICYCEANEDVIGREADQEGRTIAKYATKVIPGNRP